jgi:formate dehydrogenase major subunit
MKNAAKRGAKLIVADPRRSDLARHATYFLQFNPDTDVALLNAMIHAIVDEGLANEAFIRDRTSGYEALARRTSKASPPRRWRPSAASRQDDPRGGAALRHLEGLDHPLGHGHLAARARHRQRALPHRAGADDRPDRAPGHGLHPLRGQNNVQGASDSGLIPMFYPDYQRVDNPEARERFEKLWGAELDPKPGLTVVEIMNAATTARDPRHVHHGREPGDVGPGRRPRARGARQRSTIWSCRTSSSPRPLPRRRGPAGDGLAGEGRHGHQHRSHGAARPQGDRCRRARRARTCGSSRSSRAARPRLELRRAARRLQRDARCMDSIAGITWERLERDSR